MQKCKYLKVRFRTLQNHWWWAAEGVEWCVGLWALFDSSTPRQRNLLAATMGRMHSKGKGMSKSARPYKRQPPSWLKVSSADVEDQICKFAKKGLTPSQIGVILRDSHGVAQVKSVTGSKVLRLLKKNGAFIVASFFMGEKRKRNIFHGRCCFLSSFLEDYCVVVNNVVADLLVSFFLPFAGRRGCHAMSCRSIGSVSPDVRIRW